MNRRAATLFVTLALLALGAAGCGLKGPLTLPPPSENVIIRGPGESATTAPTETTAPEPETMPGAGNAAPEDGKPPAQPPKTYRTPPPTLPSGNPGVHDD